MSIFHSPFARGVLSVVRFCCEDAVSFERQVLDCDTSCPIDGELDSLSR